MVHEALADWLPASGYRGCAFLNMMSESPTLGGEIQAVIEQHKSELRSYIRRLVAGLDVSPQARIADATPDALHPQSGRQCPGVQ
ncbi:MAG: hypothetical protein Kow0060_04010 [Methylohalobius crimeensis]|nr:hypothetical protein [Methylothermaceae bacterium]